MSIDITSEKLIPLQEYTKMRPAGRGGKPMHLATAYRHVMHGVRGIRLEHVNFGGTICTSVEAVQRFLDALTEARSGSPTGSIPAATSPPGGKRTGIRTAAQRERAAAEADCQLARMGL